VEPENGSATLFGTLVSNMQSNVTVSNGVISGTLAYIDGGLAQSGPLSGSGNFLALKFVADDWTKFTSVKVGLEPSQGTGLVEVLTDPDKNGVFKIANTNQKFKVVTANGTETETTVYSLAGLTLNNS
jgi:hypothetical protein